MNFTETLERIQSEGADARALFEGEGSRAPSRGRTSEAYKKNLAVAASFVADVYEGKRDGRQFAEAMTTDDFPILFADILDRQVLAAYRQVIPTWEAVARRRTVRDFRGGKLFKPLTGGESRLGEVGESEEYPADAVDEQAVISLSIAKYGRRLPISWETLVNDDLDMFRDLPDRLGRAARRTESYTATELYADASGPHASLYTAGNSNIVTGNPALSITGLQTALTVFGAQTNEDGEPIEHEAITLVVPPALEVVANNIVNATALDISAAAGGGEFSSTLGEQRLLVANWLNRRLRVVVNPLLPLVSSTANGDTSWYLFGSPQSDREALAMVFLRGYETPGIFMKSPNARLIGGGEVNPLDGDFDTDSIQYKVRHVLGAARIDPKATVASDGTGSGS